MTEKQRQKTGGSGVDVDSRMRTRECINCGEEFQYEQRIGCGQKFCSPECRTAREVQNKVRRAQDRPPCSTDGCSNKADYTEGICIACYARRRRTGSLVRRQFKYRSQSSHGYILLTGNAVAGHPLMVGKSGWMYEHRKVLFDAIGHGPHPCHWCGVAVNWVRGRCISGSLVPDHLDGNKTNNAISNLVPACNKCNATRGLFMAWVTKHADDPWLWAMYQTSQRRSA